MPSLGEFFSNLRAPVPWPQKLRLLVRNNWTKLRTRRDCCGHPGEPGC